MPQATSPVTASSSAASAPRKVLLLVGSPRKRSVSGMLGESLVDRLKARGFESETLSLTGMLETQEGRARLSGEFLGADLAILAAPVYVDSFPAPVARALDFLAQEPLGGGGPRFTAVFNCGFPESSHNDICLAACRLFAREAGLAWAGGLGVGGGGAVGVTSLEERGRMTANLRKAFDLAAAALSRGLPIPQEASALAAKPLMPRRLYLLMAELGWWAEARKRGLLFRLGRRPYRKS